MGYGSSENHDMCDGSSEKHDMDDGNSENHDAPTPCDAECRARLVSLTGDIGAMQYFFSKSSQDQ